MTKLSKCFEKFFNHGIYKEFSRNRGNEISTKPLPTAPNELLKTKGPSNLTAVSKPITNQNSPLERNNTSTMHTISGLSIDIESWTD